MEVPSHHLYNILLVRSKSQALSLFLREKYYFGACISGGRDNWGYPRVCSPETDLGINKILVLGPLK